MGSGLMELLLFFDCQEEGLDLCVGLALAGVKVVALFEHIDHAHVLVYAELSEEALGDLVEHGSDYENLNYVEDREAHQPHRP